MTDTSNVPLIKRKPYKNFIGLANGIRVEWKSRDIHAGPEGVDVSTEIINAGPKFRIRIPPKVGWARLYVELQQFGQPSLLAHRFLVRVVEGSGRTESEIRPMLAACTSRKEPKRGLGQTARTLKLFSGGWTEIQGLFLRKGGNQAIVDALVNLPEDCTLEIFQIKAATMPAEVDGSVLDELREAHALVVHAFAARPLSMDSTHEILQDMKPFLAEAKISGLSLSGVVLAEPQPDRVIVRSKVGAVRCALDRVIEVVPGVRAQAGFTCSLRDLLAQGPSQRLTLHLSSPLEKAALELSLPPALSNVVLRRQAPAAHGVSCSTGPDGVLRRALLPAGGPGELAFEPRTIQTLRTARVYDWIRQMLRLETSRKASWGVAWVDHGSRVHGWIAHHTSAQPQTVRITVDNETVWEGAALRLVDGHQAGFSVDLPQPRCWSVPREVCVVRVQDGALLAPPIFAHPMDRFVGELDLVKREGNRLLVMGWAADRACPLKQLALVLEADGAAIAIAQADKVREDLKSLGAVGPSHGFLIEAELTFDDWRGRLMLRVEGTDAFLFGEISSFIEEAEIDKDVDDAFPPVSADPSELTVQGNFERLIPGMASGWARYEQSHQFPVQVDLYVDDRFYLSTISGRRRTDVGRRFGDEGLCGFSFELPPFLSAERARRIHVQSRHGKSIISNATKVLPAVVNAVAHDPVPKLPVAAIVPHKMPEAPPRIAYIILNLNGAALLKNLFESFVAHHLHPSYEIIVVDHGSTDGSIELCVTWGDRLPIQCLARGQNHSFSASNNFGAYHTDADVLVFLNNDIVLHEDVAGELIQTLSDPTIAVVGIKLLDPIEPDAPGVPPIQHLGVHLHAHARLALIDAFESRYMSHLSEVSDSHVDVPIVTGALLACRRKDFLAWGGFDEKYFYGYEDVDLCLRVVLGGGRVVCANTTSAFHVRGFTRGGDQALAPRLLENRRLVQERHGGRLRRRILHDLLERPGFWTTVAPTIAFAVTEAADQTPAGDYFTALELARELTTLLSCRPVFLDKALNWYDLSGIDILIVMRDDYDLTRIDKASPHLLKVGWARNWFERWGRREWAQDYDAIWAASDKAAGWMSQVLARPVETLRIATNPARFAAGVPDPELSSDYCFTGSFFGAPRDIVYALEPDALPYRFAIFGHGWKALPDMTPHVRGSLPYSRLPDVYASTRLVLDDANHVTKNWGSVNSRVFDAIAAGILPITNGREGAAEVFGELLPTYATRQELEGQLHAFLGDDAARQKRVAALQEVVFKSHTYAHRAAQVLNNLRQLVRSQLRFAVKIGVPRRELRQGWGDWHYALGLKRALTRLGHSVRIDCLDAWDGAHCTGDDVVIVLRGLSRFKPRPDQVTLMWNISHPDAVSVEEYESFDHVFVASVSHADRLAVDLDVPVTILLQCSDQELFHPDLPPLARAPGLLFVGNSRLVYRDMVRHCIQAGLPVEIYGSHWESLVPRELLKGTHIPNDELGRYYRSARVVLNDHWEDMRRRGFISNRIFDAASAGAFIITDEVPGLREIFGDALWYASTPDAVRAGVELTEANPDRVSAMRARASEIARSGHRFDDRAATIMRVLHQRFGDRLLMAHEEVAVIPEPAPGSEAM